MLNLIVVAIALVSLTEARVADVAGLAGAAGARGGCCLGTGGEAGMGPWRAARSPWSPHL